MLIYCVEDDDNIRELILYTLAAEGYEVEGFSEGSSFQKALGKQLPALILLDIMLPQKDGMTLLRELKESRPTKDIPVIMLTAKSAEVDKVKGLDSGADDYMTKPFGMMELLSRIRAVLRRSQPENGKAMLEHREILVNLTKHKVYTNGEEIELTLKEYDLLVFLLHHKGMALSRDQLLEGVWGYPPTGESRTVDVHIQTLRQKLGNAGAYIETIRGVGYRMEA